MIGLRHVKTIIIAVLLAAASVFVVNFVSDKYEAEATVARLERTVRDQAEANRKLAAQIIQIEEAEETADAVIIELENLRSDYALIQRAIASAKEEEDGEIAPVLRRALDDIGRLRR